MGIQKNFCTVGKFYGDWKILNAPAIGRNKNHQMHYLCRCRCKRIEKYVSAADLIKGTNQRCQLCKSERQYRGYKDLSQTLWNVIVRGARIRHLPLRITIQQAYRLIEKQQFKCALSGVHIALQKDFSSHRQDQTASLDRIDSSKGYVKGNIRWVHKNVNLMRNNYSDEEFISMCKLVANHNSNK